MSSIIFNKNHKDVHSASSSPTSGKEELSDLILNAQAVSLDALNQQKEEQAASLYQTLKISSPFEIRSRLRAQSIFTRSPNLSRKSTSVAGTGGHIEAKRYSHSTKVEDIDPEKFGKDFLRMNSLKQIEDIFSVYPLNAEQKELKVEALIYVSKQIETKTAEEKAALFKEVNAWIFSEERSKANPEFTDQCIDILLDYSLYTENAAPFLCELAGRMEEKDLTKLAMFLYSKHSNFQVFAKHTLALFTEYDLKSQTDFNTLFRDNSSLSTKLLRECLRIFFSHELQKVVHLLEDPLLNHPEKYVQKAPYSLTDDGIKLAKKFLEELYKTDLSQIEEHINLRLKVITDHFKDKPGIKVEDIQHRGISQMLFLHGINFYLEKHFAEKLKTLEERNLKTNDECGQVKVALAKFTKLLQKIHEGDLFQSGSNDVNMNKLINKYKPEHAKFVARFK